MLLFLVIHSKNSSTYYLKKFFPFLKKLKINKNNNFNVLKIKTKKDTSIIKDLTFLYKYSFGQKKMFAFLSLET